MEYMEENDKIHLSSMQQLQEARDRDDDWTGVTSREERRKRQNRLNQRAARRRKGQKHAPLQAIRQPLQETQPSWAGHLQAPIGIPNPYQEISYTLLYKHQHTLHLPQHATTAPAPLDTPLASLVSSNTPAISTPNDPLTLATIQLLTKTNYSPPSLSSFSSRSSHPATTPSPSSDHLITLIHYNVFRGLSSNILMLNIQTLVDSDCDILLYPETYTSQSNDSSDNPHPQYYTQPSIIPSPLRPTSLQLSTPHPAWVDMFPSPRARDNMIRELDNENFDVDELCFDLLGDTFAEYVGIDPALHSATHQPGQPSPPHPTTPSASEDYTLVGQNEQECREQERSGLLVWSDPWSPDSWELTEGFLRKWGWIIEGCEDMLIATNRFRMSRGELPLGLGQFWRIGDGPLGPGYGSGFV